ncbi:MAG: hypothetical protein HGA31_00285 [Candidatus Moranbacteria bacterium]|nr:hypothetical protein [Candidatus Moranbacteria bacterium]
MNNFCRLRYRGRIAGCGFDTGQGFGCSFRNPGCKGWSFGHGMHKPGPRRLFPTVFAGYLSLAVKNHPFFFGYFQDKMVGTSFGREFFTKGAWLWAIAVMRGSCPPREGRRFDDRNIFYVNVRAAGTV